MEKMKNGFTLKTNGAELKCLLDELEVIVKKINSFTLQVISDEVLVQELDQQ
jgi:hypothetical protein